MKYSIIPEPVLFKIKDDRAVFVPSCYMSLKGDENTLTSRDELLFFLETVMEITPVGNRDTIYFSVNKALSENKSAYRITVKEGAVFLEGADEEGLFYAVQTLKQLFHQSPGGLSSLEIYDEAVFSSRGFLLDCGRYFFKKEDIFRFLDLMALHKLNEFHWHLSDDQGFRCELDSFPLLTQIGSLRSHTNFNAEEHAGYYTKKDIKQIVSYAHSKHIKVIPEIDTPGHTVSMISSYPSLSCFERDLPVATHWGIKHDVLCAGKESTFDFMFRLFDELIEMFPDKIIHLGGDEVPVTRWELCPHCQKRMKAEKMSEESELHTYYLNRIGKYLTGKGIKVRMWNDRLKEKTTDYDICWQLWNNDMSENDVIEEIKRGRPFILSNSTAYYLDLPYGQVSLEKTYNFTPVYYKLPEEYRKKIEGMEACLWTEFIPDTKKADYAALPRLGAFCESAWTEEKNKSYPRFKEKLKNYYPFLCASGYLPAAPERANPKGLRKAASLIYWERRRFCWAALGNFIDNCSVKRKYKKEEV